MSIGSVMTFLGCIAIVVLSLVGFGYGVHSLLPESDQAKEARVKEAKKKKKPANEVTVFVCSRCYHTNPWAANYCGQCGFSLSGSDVRTINGAMPDADGSFSLKSNDPHFVVE